MVETSAFRVGWGGEEKGASCIPFLRMPLAGGALEATGAAVAVAMGDSVEDMVAPNRLGVRKIGDPRSLYLSRVEPKFSLGDYQIEITGLGGR